MKVITIILFAVLGVSNFVLIIQLQVEHHRTQRAISQTGTCITGWQHDQDLLQQTVNELHHVNDLLQQTVNERTNR